MPGNKLKCPSQNTRLNMNRNQLISKHDLLRSKQKSREQLNKSKNNRKKHFKMINYTQQIRSI